jgi:4-amino-4-deoxy-L-arabinose transferase-like glycosyltransferase
VIEERPLAAVALVFLAALLLRMVALFDLTATIYNGAVMPDERVYHTWAAALADGTFNSHTVYEFAPLPAYLLGGIYWLLGPDPMYFRALNVLLGSGVCVMVYLLSGAVFDKRIALASGLLAGLYGPFIFYSVVPLKTAMELFLFAATLWLFMLGIKGRLHSGGMAALGLAAGWLLNVRANSGFLIIFIPMVCLYPAIGPRRAFGPLILGLALFTVGVLVAVGPFVARNYLVTGQAALTTSQTGRNLYYGNNLESESPYYRPARFASAEPREQAVHFTIEASRRLGRTLSPGEASSFWTKEVIRGAWAEPGRFLGKFIWKILALFNRHEMGDHYHIGFTSRVAGFFKIPWPAYWLLMPLGLAGLMMRWKGSDQVKILGLIAALYAATLVVFLTNTRYRLPLMIILIPCTVAGVCSWWSDLKLRNYRRAARFVALAGVLAVLEVLPVPGAGDLTAYYNAHALLLNQMGRGSEAAEYWRESSALRGAYSFNADISLAGQSLDRRDAATALTYLERVPDDYFSTALKYRVVGDIMRRLGRLPRAAEAYEKSLAINAGQPVVRHQLIEVYAEIDPNQAEAQAVQLEWILSFYRRAGLIRGNGGS